MSKDLSTPHKRSKHFGIEWSFFKESVEHGEIRPEYVPTDLQPADMMTKSILSNKFVIFRDMIMGDSDLQSHFDVKTVVTHLVVMDSLVGQYPDKKNGGQGEPQSKRGLIGQVGL
jgi:hypothetical protein